MRVDVVRRQLVEVLEELGDFVDRGRAFVRLGGQGLQEALWCQFIHCPALMWEPSLPVCQAHELNWQVAEVDGSANHVGTIAIVIVITRGGLEGIRAAG